jgi:hypothetical protein
MKLDFKSIILIFFLLLNFIIPKAENEQTNPIGTDWIVDIPWKVKSEQNFIPVLIGVMHVNLPILHKKISAISIYTKKTSDTEFNQLFQYKDDVRTHIVASSQEEINFIPFQTEYLSNSNNKTIDIRNSKNKALKIKGNWYFMLGLPKQEILQAHQSAKVLDIRIVIHSNNNDINFDFRVWLPQEKAISLNNWYGGDTHFHSYYTRNVLEFGLPLKASQIALESIGVDWQMVTDHSCDFDNHGQSILDIWQSYVNEIKSLNQSNKTLMIPGIEASLLSEDNKLIHMLVFPPPNAMYSLPYIGDGHGDIIQTGVSVNDALEILDKIGGFAYAAHPFAEKDKLALIGSIWNISHPNFPRNEEPMPSTGTVICNSLSYPSDVFSANANEVFKSALVGAEMWNVMNTLHTEKYTNTPWTSKEFVPYKTQETAFHETELAQGMDVMKFLWKIGLIAKSNNPDIQDFRFFIAAGTDAHGSFNYSNTENKAGIFGGITDNAIGKLLTYTYCPNKMGTNGENVLTALKNGNTIISNGPLVELNITEGNKKYFHGDFFEYKDEIKEHKITIHALSSKRYGEINSLKIILGTAEGEEVIFEDAGNLEIEHTYDLESLILEQLTQKQTIYLRAEITTERIYNQEEQDIYLKEKEQFRALTNPIWISTSF